MGNLLRDLAALNKRELLPWDCWGLMEKQKLSDKDYALLDEVAQVIVRGDERILSIYQREGLRVPRKIKSYREDGPVTVDLE